MQWLWILIPKHGGMQLHQPLALGLQQPMGVGAVAHPSLAHLVWCHGGGRLN